MSFWDRFRRKRAPEAVQGAVPAPEGAPAAAPAAPAATPPPVEPPAPVPPEPVWTALAEALLANRDFRDVDPALHRALGNALRNAYADPAHIPGLRDMVERVTKRWDSQTPP